MVIENFFEVYLAKPLVILLCLLIIIKPKLFKFWAFYYITKTMKEDQRKKTEKVLFLFIRILFGIILLFALLWTIGPLFN